MYKIQVKDFVSESYKTPPTDNEGYKRLVETTKSALLKRLNLNDFMIKMSFKTKRILLLTIQVKPHTGEADEVCTSMAIQKCRRRQSREFGLSLR